ncbi:hypothetical protein K1X12_04845 [Hyphomonas sp. WL0036]|uniref:hypothetical protein n=1 Tax=Hyphomonas sediminis TaxID=2866160 RepID=UPI001C80F11D|nr:hypothetical protein [Hyphomonas sediminis]MBY9066214.1 hypothetical protein [Hyphomonas sediminis]
MLDSLQSLFNGIALISCAMAIGASWVASVASPNCSFDKLTGARADSHVRELLYRTATPISGMMLVSGALFLLATSWISGVVALVSSFGFFSTRLMLAPKEGKNPKGVRTRRKEQRGSSVLLSLMFTIGSVAAALLGLFGL